jgi:hypothetical protein
MEKITLETVQWSKLKEIDTVEPISDKDHVVLTEIREILTKYQYTDRFGVCLLHKHFDVGEDEVLMETTNMDRRVSTIAVEKAGDHRNTIETMWKFGLREEEITKCVLRCHYWLGHKQRHHTEGS